jgi:putative transposase
LRKSRDSDEQIAAALRQAEAGTTIAGITRKLGIAEATFYAWRKRFGSLGTPEIRELRHLTLDRQVLQDVVKKVVRKVRLFTMLPKVREIWRLRERRICRILDINRKMLHYRSVKVDDPILRTRIEEIAYTRIRYGAARLMGILESREARFLAPRTPVR